MAEPPGEEGEGEMIPRPLALLLAEVGIPWPSPSLPSSQAPPPPAAAHVGGELESGGDAKFSNVCPIAVDSAVGAAGGTISGDAKSDKASAPNPATSVMRLMIEKLRR